MKKNIRKINVRGQVYTWMISSIDPNFICLKIWLGDTKSIPWIMVRYRFDDPWLHYGELLHGTPERIEKYFQLTPIKPSLIAQIIINAYNIAPIKAEKIKKILHYQSDINGELEPIKNANIPGKSPWAKETL